MQFPVLLEAFNGRDIFSRDARSCQDTRTSGIAIDQDCARAADSFAAAVFATGQIKAVAQDRKQTFIFRCLVIVLFSIDR